ncbi:MAG: two-component regulator propeller domain-containing protein [Spirosomataceae bacterium]
MNIEKFYQFFLCVAVGGAVLGLMIACNQSQKSASSPAAAEVLKTKGYTVPKNRVTPAKTLPMGSLKVVNMGTPTVVPINDNSKPVKTTIVPAGIPVVYTPGKDSFTLSQAVPAVYKIIPAGRPQAIVAQPAYTNDYNPYNFNLFGLMQGLVETQIHTLLQDSKGNIWLGTFNGVSKYNGKTFENFTMKEGLIDNFIETIYEDKAGNIWLGTRSGASKYDGRSFTNYKINEGAVVNYVMEILEDRQGNIWFATNGNGVAKLDKSGKTITHFTEKEGLANRVRSIMEDRRGTIWFGTQGNGLVKYDGQSFAHYTQKEGLSDNTIMRITEDKTGNIWLSTWGGVLKYDGKFFHHTIGLTYGWATDIQEDRLGAVWFGTIGGGVFRLEASGQSITNFTTDVGLADNIVLSLIEDKAGTLWFGTEKGLVKYSQLFRSFTQEDGLLSNNVRCLVQDWKNTVWVGTENGGGVSRFDLETKTITNFTQKEGLPDRNVLSLLEDKKGNIWLGTNYGALCYLDSTCKTLTHLEESGGYIVCIFEDKAGNIWYSSREKGGVFRINQGTQTRTHFTTQQGLCHDQVIRIFQDKAGNMWFCTFGGVSRLDKDGRTFTNYTEKEGMNFDIFESIIEDRRGDFWFGTLGGGITRLDVRYQTLRHFTEAEGLSHNTVFGLREDKAGNLWISCRTGLDKLSKKELEKIAATPSAPVLPFFKHYTPENGNMGFAEGRYYLLETKNGDLWIPKLDRLTIYHPQQDRPNPEVPTVQLTNIKLYNEAIAWRKDSSYVLKNGFTVQDFTFKDLSRWQRIPEELSLAYNNNFLTFEFAGTNTTAPQSVSYQYRLKGLENNWSAITSRSEATYGNLPPGSYTFNVKAMNEEGVWSRELAYSFIIRPPWWQTWWCYLLYSAIIGGLIYVFIQYRVAQRIARLKALEAIRTKISGDLHDDVGTILSGLAMQSQMMALTAKVEQKEALNELSAMSQDAMERMRDTVWTIDSRKDKYENLIDRMRDFAERNLNRKHISHDFKVEVEDGKKFIDPQRRQHIYLIFKEAITNIIKHSDASHVQIVFSEQKNRIRLLIHDNGSPPKTETSSDGLGLSNMHMRAAQLGGPLTATYENGFKVELRLG